MSAPERRVHALALCREGRILASHMHSERGGELTLADFEGTLRRIFSSPGWAQVQLADKRKLELREPGALYCLELDAEGRVYVAVVSPAYPTRCVFSAAGAAAAAAGGGGRLFEEFAAGVLGGHRAESLTAADKGLKRALRGFLRSLAARYDDVAALDKIASVERRAEGLKADLHKALLAVDDRSRLLSTVEAQSSTLASSAKEMFTNARKIKNLQRAACCRAFKRPIVCCSVCCLVLVLLGVVVGLLNQYVFKWVSLDSVSVGRRLAAGPGGGRGGPGGLSPPSSSSSSSSLAAAWSPWLQPWAPLQETGGGAGGEPAANGGSRLRHLESSHGGSKSGRGRRR